MKTLVYCFDQLHFPDEDAVAAMFSNIPISSALQHGKKLIDQYSSNTMYVFNLLVLFYLLIRCNRLFSRLM